MNGDSLEQTDAAREPLGSADGDGPAPLSWPLVERRKVTRVLAEDAERRIEAENAPSGPTAAIEAAPLVPFRIAALIGAVIRGAHLYRWNNWSLNITTVLVTLFTAFLIWRPVPYCNDNRSRLRTVVEIALLTGAVIVTGAWESPFALCLVPTIMLASFVGGTILSAQLLVGSGLIVTVQQLHDQGARNGLADAALWIGLLGVVSVTSGLSYRAAHEAARQKQAALDRVGRLAEANALLFSLQRVAQTLPASLDLEDVLDSTVARVQSLIEHSMLTILLQTEHADSFDPVRVLGYSSTGIIVAADLPSGLAEALNQPKTVRRDDVSATTQCLAPNARSGLYAALRARGSVIGLIAIEAVDPHHFGPQQAEILHGLAEPFGIAIDNAKLFQRLRISSADEERNRIARDLHDHIGSSLAFLGFEIDRSVAAAARGESVEDALRELRKQVTSMVGEVRETLYDLRSEVSEAQDLATTLREFVDRMRGRSGLDITFTSDQRVRLEVSQEREFWHIAREAMINVERHAQATQAALEWTSTPSHAVLTIRDNGVGLVVGSGRVDSYGMRGMRERAASIGAQMTTESSPTGTVIRVGLHQPKGIRRWD